MFFLFDMFQDGNALSPAGTIGNYDTIQIQNGIYDHLNLLNMINVSTNIFDTTKPTSWISGTLMNARFDNTLEAGSIGELYIYVDHLELQRKAQDEDSWITLQTFYKEPQTGIIKSNFRLEDPYTRNNVIYTYQLVPFDSAGNTGTALQQQVLSVYNDAYIVDASNVYNITYEYQLSKQTNQNSVTYTPYGSQYPLVAFNALTKYDSGKITAILLSKTSQTGGYIDRNAQANLEKEFNYWLTNGRAKILKDFNGLFKLIVVIDIISNDYTKELGNGISSTSFSFVEVGDFSQEYLNKLAMVEKFPIQYR